METAELTVEEKRRHKKRGAMEMEMDGEEQDGIEKKKKKRSKRKEKEIAGDDDS